jgi:hypothetical protein
MAMRLEKENVRIILFNMLDEVEMWNHTDNDAEKRLCYIAGLTDMANAVIEAIGALGGK